MIPAIRLEHVSKKFILHRERPRSFQELLTATPRRIGQAARREVFWALKDVSFEVTPGQGVGLIGANGAGKSTALKIVSRIIQPTSGKVSVHGRVGALLELGAGFHGDLTGRENIYLNGSILGLDRRRIHQKLDEIVAFAELERFLDVPVKHYSSGMYVRLGFSVAAHIDPDLLLIDEVLAVGDQNFQHKCVEHIMKLKQAGVTICFVSHSLDAVRQLCSQAVWLENGVVEAAGDVEDTIGAYLAHAASQEEARLVAEDDARTSGSAPAEATAPPPQQPPGAAPEAGEQVPAAAAAGHGALAEEGQPAEAPSHRWGRGDAEVIRVSFLDGDGNRRFVFRSGEPWAVQVDYRAHRYIEKPVFGLAVHRQDGVHVCGPNTHFAGLDIPSIEGAGSVTYRVENLTLLEGTYDLSLSIHNQADTEMYDYHDRRYRFRVRRVGPGERYGVVSLGGTWTWRHDSPEAVDTPPVHVSGSQGGC